MEGFSMTALNMLFARDRKILFILILFFALVQLSCNNRNLITSTGDDQTNTNPGTVALRFVQSPVGITQVVAHLTRQGFSGLMLVLTIRDSGGGASGTLDNVAAGTWHLEVDALNDSGVVKYSGQADVDVIGGQTIPVSLVLHPATGSIEITVTWGGSCVMPPQGIAHWWTADSNEADIIGGNSAHFMNGATYGTGKVGSAFSFDGVSAYVVFIPPPYPVRFPPLYPIRLAGSFTVEAWIYPTNDSIGAVFSQWGGYYEWTNQRCVGFGMIKGGNLRFGVTDTAHQNDESFHDFDTQGGVLTVNSWNHVAAVYNQDLGERQIFVNGTQVAERTDPPFKIFQSIASFTCGAQEFAPGMIGSNFSGKIDELSLYDRALSPDEIAGIYQAGSYGKCH